MLEIDGIGPHSAFGIKLVQEVAREFLKEKIIDKPIYRSSQEIFDYLYHSMRDLKKEVFKVIYLSSQNQIIETADLFEGTINSSSISPREVIENAIISEFHLPMMVPAFQLSTLTGSLTPSSPPEGEGVAPAWDLASVMVL